MAIDSHKYDVIFNVYDIFIPDVGRKYFYIDLQLIGSIDIMCVNQLMKNVCPRGTPCKNPKKDRLCDTILMPK